MGTLGCCCPSLGLHILMRMKVWAPSSRCHAGERKMKRASSVTWGVAGTHCDDQWLCLCCVLTKHLASGLGHNKAAPCV